MSTEQLLTYDVCPSPLLYNKHGTMTKPEQYELLTELKMGLEKSDCETGKVDAQIVAVMGVVRKLKSLNFKTFGHLATEFHRLTECYEVAHYVFDMYITTSAKDPERLRMHMKILFFLLSNSHPQTPALHSQRSYPDFGLQLKLKKKLLEKFLYDFKKNAGSAKTVILGQDAREQAYRSTMLTSEDSNDVPELGVVFEEADHRIPSRTFYQANQGSANLCNYLCDTDVAVALLHHMPLLKLSTLAEVWMKAGGGVMHRTFTKSR